MNGPAQTQGNAMKNSSDVICGLVLLVLCAIGAVSTSSLPSPIKTEVVGPAYVPMFTFIIISFCALLLIVFGIRKRSRNDRWGNKKAVAKALVFFAFYVIYLVALYHYGPTLYFIDDFPFRHSVGFAVTNVIFLYAACRCLGRTNKTELLLVSVGATALLILVFSVFFKVLLP
jgi:uncharacterized membrane protein YozB (DUF420 family)